MGLGLTYSGDEGVYDVMDQNIDTLEVLLMENRSGSISLRDRRKIVPLLRRAIERRRLTQHEAIEIAKDHGVSHKRLMGKRGGLLRRFSVGGMVEFKSEAAFQEWVIDEAFVARVACGA